MDTEFGRIAGMLSEVAPGPTPLQQNLDRLGATLGRAGAVVIALIALSGWLRGQPLLEMLLFGIALAVAVVPEALPAVVTISLAIGVQKMVRRHALVRRLTAVETLGSTSVILTDKTGTLTRDEMTVREIHCCGANIELGGAGYAPVGEFLAADGTPIVPDEPLCGLLEAATLACDAELLCSEEDGVEAWRIKGDPTEGALVVAAAKAGLQRHALEMCAPRVAEFPFSAESKRMTVVVRGPEGLRACAKGAPEVILEACDRECTAGGMVPLDGAACARILAAAQDMAARALRVLAIAARPVRDADEAQSGMVFLGLAGMIDPPRPEVDAAIARCREAGVRVVMITGDHPLTARAVAAELGLADGAAVVSGGELERMTDAELQRRIAEIPVFARVSPAHKLRVVSAWQAAGQVVAMTGDGVNDAPALKQADVGIAMGISGTDVSREAAAITLTDDNFASIVAAVEEGRGVFDNIHKYLMYLLSANVGEIGLMAGTMLLGLPLPLAAVQILYVNLATQGLPALALAVDPPAADLMRRPPRDPRKGIFSREVIGLMMLGGIWEMLVNLGVFAWALAGDGGLPHAMTLCFLTLVLVQFVKAYCFRSERESVFRGTFGNRWLNAAVCWEMAMLALVLNVPLLLHAFRLQPLGLTDWAVAIAGALSIVPVLEIGKIVVRRLRPSARGVAPFA
jgi:Ca2+-transporting ATPase